MRERKAPDPRSAATRSANGWHATGDRIGPDGTTGVVRERAGRGREPRVTEGVVARYRRRKGPLVTRRSPLRGKSTSRVLFSTLRPHGGFRRRASSPTVARRPFGNALPRGQEKVATRTPNASGCGAAGSHPVNAMSSSTIDPTTLTETSAAPFSTAASDALADIQRLSKTLPLDDLLADEEGAARTAVCIPIEMILLAAGVLEDNAGRFHGGFDAQAMRDAIDYERAMGPLVTALTQLTRRVARSIQKHRGGSATQALAVYQTLKGFVRLSKAEPTYAALKDMEALLTTNRKRRATTVTQADVADARSKLRRAKVAAAKAAEASDALKAATDAAKEAGIEPSPSPHAPAALPR